MPTTIADRFWAALTARIEADGGVLHRSSFDEVAGPFLAPPVPRVRRPTEKEMALARATYVVGLSDDTRACLAKLHDFHFYKGQELTAEEFQILLGRAQP